MKRIIIVINVIMISVALLSYNRKVVLSENKMNKAEVVYEIKISCDPEKQEVIQGITREILEDLPPIVTERLQGGWEIVKNEESEYLDSMETIMKMESVGNNSEDNKYNARKYGISLIDKKIYLPPTEDKELLKRSLAHMIGHLMIIKEMVDIEEENYIDLNDRQADAFISERNHRKEAYRCKGVSTGSNEMEEFYAAIIEDYVMDKRYLAENWPQIYEYLVVTLNNI